MTTGSTAGGSSLKSAHWPDEHDPSHPNGCVVIKHVFHWSLTSLTFSASKITTYLSEAAGGRPVNHQNEVAAKQKTDI